MAIEQRGALETFWEFSMPRKSDTKVMLTREVVAGREQVQFRTWKLVPKWVGGPKEWIPTSGVYVSRDEFDDELFAAMENLRNSPRMDKG